MRTAAAVFAASHGIGYVIWFMSAWTPSALNSSKNLAFSNAPAMGMLGTALGLVSLAVLAGCGVGVGHLAGDILVAGFSHWFCRRLDAGRVRTWNPVGIVSLLATTATSAWSQPLSCRGANGSSRRTEWVSFLGPCSTRTTWRCHGVTSRLRIRGAVQCFRFPHHQTPPRAGTLGTYPAGPGGPPWSVSHF
jgi:hypothetical protein